MSSFLLVFLAACVPGGGDKTHTVTVTDTGACVGDTAPTVDSTPPTGDDTGPTTTHDSGDSTATTHDPADPDHDYDGDGWTENEGDCNDIAATVHPHKAESCYTTGDDDCDGLENENCSRVYWDKAEASVLFDDFGAMFLTQRWVFTTEAGVEICDQLYNVANSYGLVSCPQCDWTFDRGLETYHVAWAAQCAANFGMTDDGGPQGVFGEGAPLGYASYYRTEAGEIWGPVLLRYVGGEWYPTYGVNQSGGYSKGPITVVNFGERSLMYYSDAYSDWEYRPYGYYSSPWP